MSLLSWKNVSMTVANNSCSGAKKSVQLLNNVSGTAKPKQLLCILGHSGSGKTSLLNVLAGRPSSTGKGYVQREIAVDGIVVNYSSKHYKEKIAYIEQRDSLLSTATPREAIRFSARLRLPSSFEDDYIDSLTEEILQELRLLVVASNIIGRVHPPSGLSGGEKRRVSLGTELVIRPKLLFLDEVTSGLDSHNAFIVMQTCKHVAESGATLLMTIHQPNSKLFELMDHIYLMHEGRCMFNGEANHALDYFETRGFCKPNHYSPCDWMMEVPQTTETTVLESVGFFEDSTLGDKVSQLSQQENNSEFFNNSASNNSFGSSIRWRTEVNEQLLRDIRNVFRDHQAMVFRFVMVAIGTALVAITFQGVGEDSLADPVSFHSHVGAIFFIVLGSLIILQMSLLEYVEVRWLYTKKLASRHYGIITFGLTKLLMEACTTFLQVMIFALIIFWSLPISAPFEQLVAIQYTFTMIGVSLAILAGTATKDPRTAREFIPMWIAPRVLFAGYFVAVEDLPRWLQWVPWVMPSTYVWRLYLSQEFSICVENVTDPSSTVALCRLYLEAQDATGSENTKYWCILAGMFVFLRLFALFILSQRAKRC